MFASAAAAFALLSAVSAAGQEGAGTIVEAAQLAEAEAGQLALDNRGAAEQATFSFSHVYTDVSLRVGPEGKGLGGAAACPVRGWVACNAWRSRRRHRACCGQRERDGESEWVTHSMCH